MKSLITLQNYRIEARKTFRITEMKMLNSSTYVQCSCSADVHVWSVSSYTLCSNCNLLHRYRLLHNSDFNLPPPSVQCTGFLAQQVH